MRTILSFLSRHLAFALMAAIVLAVGALLVFDSAGMPQKTESEFVPHVLCTSGRTVVKREGGTVTVMAEKSEPVKPGDQIKTLRQSTATIFWNDGSVTRLAENTTIDITELSYDRKTSVSKVEFSILSGKSWSRIYRYLSGDSHFRQRFDDGTKLAAVRGTAFEINADEGYLKTRSHAVDVTDGSGKLLATVPEGVVVNVRNLQALIRASLDGAWEKSNVAEDSKYAAEVLSRAKEDLSSRLRAMQGSPVTASFSGESLSISLSPEYAKLATEGRITYSEMLKAYEVTAAFANDARTIRSRETLRDAILAWAPESEKAELATLFARHETFDSWASGIAEEEFLRMRKKLREYVEMGANRSEIERLESALPKDRIDSFNATMESLRAKGFKELSNPELFVTPSKSLFDQATKGVGEVLDAAAEKFVTPFK